MNEEDFERVIYPVCFFKRHGFADDECRFRDDGYPDRAHFIPQARVRATGGRRGWDAAKVAGALLDPRAMTLSCRHHHLAFDSKLKIRLRRDDYPKSFQAWAIDYGFFFHSPREGWIAEYDYPERAA